MLITGVNQPGHTCPFEVGVEAGAKPGGPVDGHLRIMYEYLRRVNA